MGFCAFSILLSFSTLKISLEGDVIFNGARDPSTLTLDFYCGSIFYLSSISEVLICRRVANIAFDLTSRAEFGRSFYDRSESLDLLGTPDY